MRYTISYQLLEESSELVSNFSDLKDLEVLRLFLGWWGCLVFSMVFIIWADSGEDTQMYDSNSL